MPGRTMVKMLSSSGSGREVRAGVPAIGDAGLAIAVL